MTSRPDRPIPGRFRFLRSVLRALRILQWRLRLGRKLTLGTNVMVGPRASVFPPGFLRIGDNVAIGSDFRVDCDLIIGSDVLISSRVSIIGNDHRFDDVAETIYWAGRLPPASVVLEGDNLVGFGAIIVAPARIGRGAIVGAGSVVTRDIPPDSVCAGVPARYIRARRRLSLPVE